MTIANVAVTFFLLGATMVLTPFVFAMAMGWIGENAQVVKRGEDAQHERTNLV